VQGRGRASPQPKAVDRFDPSYGTQFTTALQALEANGCYRSIPLAPTNENEDTPDAVTIGTDEPGY
jgi:hypothetical protein